MGMFTLLTSGLYWQPAVSRDWGLRAQLSLFACFSPVHGSVVPETQGVSQAPFLAALSSSRRLVVGPSVGPSVGWLVGRPL